MYNFSRGFFKNGPFRKEVKCALWSWTNVGWKVAVWPTSYVTSYPMLIGLSYFSFKKKIDDKNSRHPLNAYYVSGRYKTLHVFP